MEEPDVELAARALYDAHGPALRAWARRRVADQREAEDVVQETLVRAWRKQHLYDPARGSERAWVFGIARNVAADHDRRDGRRLRLVPRAATPVDEAVDPMPDLDRVVEGSLVRDALLALSVDHRRVIVEAYYRGRTVRETAVHLSIPEGTVKSRLYHALRSLRAELEARGVVR